MNCVFVQFYLSCISRHRIWYCPGFEHPSDNTSSHNQSHPAMSYSPVCSWHFAEAPLSLPETTAYPAFSSDILRSSDAPCLYPLHNSCHGTNVSVHVPCTVPQNICTFPSALPVPVWMTSHLSHYSCLPENAHVYALYLYAPQTVPHILLTRKTPSQNPLLFYRLAQRAKGTGSVAYLIKSTDPTSSMYRSVLHLTYRIILTSYSIVFNDQALLS